MNIVAEREVRLDGFLYELLFASYGLMLGAFNLISLVVTSCGRFDLLFKTLESFFKFNTSKLVTQIIVIDDSGVAGAYEIIDKFFENIKSIFDVKIIANENNIGQVRSIDLAYSFVTNPYIFHLEDDWEFYQVGFVELSLDVIQKFPWVVTVWLRAHNDTMRHPIEPVAGLPFHLLGLNYENRWHGFTWNPGLRRLSDYRFIRNFAAFGPGESIAGQWYMEKGYRAAILNVPQGFVRHIGWFRSTAHMSGTQKG